MKRGDRLEFQIEKYAFEGKGISRIQKEDSEDTKSGYVVFVNGAYPGDKVIARITKTKKSFAEAVTEKILSPSPYRIEAKCKYFGTCGGCKQQDLNYTVQLSYKQEQVKEIFEKLGGLSDFNTEDIIPSEKDIFLQK